MNLLFDIGGTHMRFATSEGIGKPIILETPQAYDQALQEFERVKSELGIDQYDLIAGGIAGPFNQAKDELVNAPHLTDWVGKPIAKDLKDIFDCEVLLENDTALIGLGEAVRGAGTGNKIVGFIGIGTGVGGARILNNQIDQSAFGFEPGHQIINIEDNQHFTFEDYVSGSGIERKYGKSPSEIEDDSVWSEVAEWLAIGLHNVTLLWSPDVIVLGGGMINSGRIPLDEVISKFSEIVTIFPNPPEIKQAELGDRGGLVGAEVLISHR